MGDDGDDDFLSDAQEFLEEPENAALALFALGVLNPDPCEHESKRTDRLPEPAPQKTSGLKREVNRAVALLVLAVVMFVVFWLLENA